MTINEIMSSIEIPSHVKNANTVQDALKRYRRALDLSAVLTGEPDPESPRCIKARLDVLSWIGHAS